jgi:selenide,water dikinase
MLQASKPALLAELDLQALPLLAGAQHCAAAGVVSSLFDANRQWAQALLEDAAGAEPARQALLFDPQTAGGLLAGVPAHRVPACMAALAQAGYGQASVIGWVKLKGEGDGDGARDPLLRLLPAQAPDGEAS